jgi:hypothetical protein
LTDTASHSWTVGKWISFAGYRLKRLTGAAFVAIALTTVALASPHVTLAHLLVTTIICAFAPLAMLAIGVAFLVFTNFASIMISCLCRWHGLSFGESLADSALLHVYALPRFPNKWVVDTKTFNLRSWFKHGAIHDDLTVLPVLCEWIRDVEQLLRTPGLRVFARGLSLLERGEYRAAIDLLTDAQVEMLSDPAPFVAQAYCFDQVGELEQALSQLQIALRLPAIKPQVFLVTKADYELRLGRFGDVENTISEYFSLSSRERDVEAFEIRGKARLLIGSDTEAWSDLEKAVELGTSESWIYLYRGKTFFRKGPPQQNLWGDSGSGSRPKL